MALRQRRRTPAMATVTMIIAGSSPRSSNTDWMSV